MHFNLGTDRFQTLPNEGEAGPAGIEYRMPNPKKLFPLHKGVHTVYMYRTYDHQYGNLAGQRTTTLPQRPERCVHIRFDNRADDLSRSARLWSAVCSETSSRGGRRRYHWRACDEVKILQLLWSLGAIVRIALLFEVGWGLTRTKLGLASWSIDTFLNAGGKTRHYAQPVGPCSDAASSTGRPWP